MLSDPAFKKLDGTPLSVNELQLCKLATKVKAIAAGSSDQTGFSLSTDKLKGKFETLDNEIIQEGEDPDDGRDRGGGGNGDDDLSEPRR